MRLRRIGPALLAAALLAAGCRGSNPSPGESPASPASPPAGQAQVLAVKIDNVAAARPATGLGSADVVYVAPVEGGLTRIIAVFSAKIPDVVGPVRSARETDIAVLAQYGRLAFAYSGAAPQILPALRGASLVNAAQSDVPGAYFRQPGHPAPHNLYVRTASLPAGRGPAPPAVLAFGPAPAGGEPSTGTTIGYSSASYALSWSSGSWLISMDGTPFLSTEAGQLRAATVIEQKVGITYEPFAEDATGARAPVAHTVGAGSAVVFRDGRSYPATWSRPALAAPTAFATSTGQALPLASGPVWVFLVPAGG
ncbi:DUF3048 domain-containing protein [Amycolatopsis benzoatilytica]|uniref:DUF3048 domain-containing protein n=1 Tax=Amycolatopsis benzoatilytica TaxID=346045 RepID=UPI001FDEE1FD|nr:DUF3048 domain-containing protein [Amycolatopsis benzoatilytica]